MKIRPLAAFMCLKIKSDQMPTREFLQSIVENPDWSDHLIRYYEVHAEALKKFKTKSNKLHNSTFLPLLLLGAKSTLFDFKELEAND